MTFPGFPWPYEPCVYMTAWTKDATTYSNHSRARSPNGCNLAWTRCLTHFTVLFFIFRSCVQVEAWPVDDISESVFAVGWVNGRTGVAGDEVGSVVEQVHVDQVQTSEGQTHRHHVGGYVAAGEGNRKQCDNNTKAWHLIGECDCLCVF